MSSWNYEEISTNQEYHKRFQTACAKESSLEKLKHEILHLQDVNNNTYSSAHIRRSGGKKGGTRTLRDTDLLVPSGGSNGQQNWANILEQQWQDAINMQPEYIFKEFVDYVHLFSDAESSKCSMACWLITTADDDLLVDLIPDTKEFIQSVLKIHGNILVKLFLNDDNDNNSDNNNDYDNSDKWWNKKKTTDSENAKTSPRTLFRLLSTQALSSTQVRDICGKLFHKCPKDVDTLERIGKELR